MKNKKSYYYYCNIIHHLDWVRRTGRSGSVYYINLTLQNLPQYDIA